MAAVDLIAATTDAVTTKRAFHTSNYERVQITAFGLAGAEEVDIFFGGGADWEVLADLTGTPLKLTNTINSIEVAAGPLYAVTKDATVGAASVQINLTGAGY